MAQLSDDCFAFGGALMSVDQAQALIAERIPPLAGEEVVGLRDALGRVLAGDLLAPLPLPPFFNSAVDGYAFRHADLAASGETRLPVVARLQAGEAAAAIAPGTSIRIFTGAAMPAGADTVMMQEDAREEAGAVLLPAGLKRGANCRPAGEDVARGAVALADGRRLLPPDIGLAAALGMVALPVRRRVRVGVFSTGDELAEPGTPLGQARTYDSNRFTLLALLAGLPVKAVDLGILPDDRLATVTALARAASAHDLLLTSGGVSAGEADHVKAAIAEAGGPGGDRGGGSLVFWRLAIKPGRPAAMGLIAGTPVIGLPGNPVAAVVTFLHLARPLVLRLAGAQAEEVPRFVAQADFSYRKKAGRREYVRVRLQSGEGLPVAIKFPREGAGLLSSLTQSDALAELPEESLGVSPGDPIRVLPFRALF